MTRRNVVEGEAFGIPVPGRWAGGRDDEADVRRRPIWSYLLPFGGRRRRSTSSDAAAQEASKVHPRSPSDGRSCP